ncbi:MAG: FMN-binding protein [Phycisphaerae bacterium]|nr:FMN-binding protein [Phycisphaerae bacterium]
MSNSQPKNPILFFLQQSWLLMVSAILFGTLLASLNYAWSPKIKNNETNKFNALAGGLLTDATTFETALKSAPIDIGKGKTYDVQVKKALNRNGNLVGWAFVCEGSGFADKIKLVVGVDAAFEKMAGFGVLGSNETPGFGDKITIKPEDGGFFQPQFIGTPVAELTLSKIGNPEKIDSEIIAISGATVTSEAVVKTFNMFLLPIKEKMTEEGLLQ